MGENDEDRIVELARTAAGNGASITAEGVRNTLGVEYGRAYRLLHALAQAGRLQTTNDAYGRKRWTVQ